MGLLLFLIDILSLCSQMSQYVASKVYVGGIPYRYTEDDIRYYFEGCGTIIDVDCMKFPDTGKFRGIAIITFEVIICNGCSYSLINAKLIWG